ncbi:MAG: outer membrane lipoprotein carrier protein LolA [Chitinispirillales bacterium]|jgi:hypothetical protein|nr:outer membrane lipoprotein carrier protein LolA [Chitinispirillales bacterium]
MKKIFIFLFISISIFAQSDIEYLQNIISKDSIVRANFIQTKQIKSLDKPLVSEGKILVVKNKGVVWILQSPTYIKKVISFDQDNASRSFYMMIAPFLNGDFSSLQKRFEFELTKSSDSWTMKISPKSAAMKRNFKYVSINGCTNGKFQDVSIFSSDDSFVRINFVSEILTNQFLSKDEELLFE